MKIGHVEGTPEEIKNFTQNNGLKPEIYFQLPEQQIKAIWLVIPASLMVLALAVLALITSLSPRLQWFSFLLGCGGAIFLTATVQLKFKQPWASAIVGVGGVLLLLVAFGLVTPLQAFDLLRSLKN